MITVYRTGFPIALVEGQDTVAAVVSTCLSWALQRPGIETHHHSLAKDSLPSLPLTAIGAGYVIETRLLNAQGKRAWAMRFKHPHREGNEVDDQIEWCTEIGIVEKSDSLTFCCSVSVGRSDSAFAPVRFVPTRPRVVLDLLRRFSCGGKVHLSEKPYELIESPDDARLFRTLLESSSRQHPVVFVTPQVPGGEFAADYQSIAHELAGLAYVVVASSPEATRFLGNELPAQLNCWDGGVRIYWPRFSISQSAFAHPLWFWWKIRRFNERYPAAFAKELLKRIASVAVLSLDPDWLTWSRVEGQERSQAIEHAKSLGDTAELLTLYVKDNEELKAAVRRLEAQLQAKAQELQIVQAKSSSYEAALERIKEGSTGEIADEVPPLTVAEAVKRAKSKFSDKFVFVWNSKSEPEGPFEDPEEVFQAFVWLATNYYDAKSGKRTGKTLKDDIRESLGGWFYSGRQSESLMKNFKEWYQCQDSSGRKYWLPEHIGTGSSKDPRQTIRISFAWDKDSQKVILGFIGQHQRNRAT